MNLMELLYLFYLPSVSYLSSVDNFPLKSNNLDACHNKIYKFDISYNLGKCLGMCCSGSLRI